MSQVQAPKEAVLPQLQNTEKWLAKCSRQAASYEAEMQKLVRTGYVVKWSLVLKKGLQAGIIHNI